MLTFFHCVSYRRWFDLALVRLISWYSFSYGRLDALVCHCRYLHLISVRTLINPYIFNFLYELISATTHLMDLGSPQCTTALHTVTYHKKGMRLQNKPCIAIPVLKAPRKTIGVIYRYNDSLSTANAGGWVSRSFWYSAGYKDEICREEEESHLGSSSERKEPCEPRRMFKSGDATKVAPTRSFWQIGQLESRNQDRSEIAF